MLLPAISDVVEPILRAHETAAENHGLMLDMVTCSSINCVADSLAQHVEDQSMDMDMSRVARFGVFGWFDGAVAHAWFALIDRIVGDDGTVAETALKVLGDAAVYTPLWCVTLQMPLAEGPRSMLPPQDSQP